MDALIFFCFFAVGVVAGTQAMRDSGLMVKEGNSRSHFANY